SRSPASAFSRSRLASFAAGPMPARAWAAAGRRGGAGGGSVSWKTGTASSGGRAMADSAWAADRRAGAASSPRGRARARTGRPGLRGPGVADHPKDLGAGGPEPRRLRGLEPDKEDRQVAGARAPADAVEGGPGRLLHLGGRVALLRLEQAGNGPLGPGSDRP